MTVADSIGLSSGIRRFIFAVQAMLLFVTACNETEVRPDVPLPRGGGPALYNYKFHEDASEKVIGTLVSGAKARVDFFIGPAQDPRGKNAIKEPVSAKFESLLSDHADTDILVRMTCWVCDGAPVSAKVVHYLTTSRASTSATFEFTPNEAMSSQTDKRITFDITIGGSYVESVQAEFKIQNAAAVSSNTQVRAESKPLNAVLQASAISRDFQSADLELTVGLKGGNVQLTFYTQNVALRAALASNGISAEQAKNPVSFDTQVQPSAIYALSAYFYCQASYWFHDSAEATATLTNCATPGPPLVSVGDKFSPADGDRVLKFVGQHGWILFDTLFKPAQGPNVALKYINALNQLAAVSDHKLLIDIVSPGVYLPWPMIITSSADADLGDFSNYWGAKFQISDRPGSSDSYPRSLEGIASNQEIEFLTFKDDPPPVANSIGDRGKQLATSVLTEIHDPTSPQIAQSKAQMLALLGTRRDQLKLIVAHMHGETAGTNAPERLIFHSDDYLDATELYIQTGVIAAGKPLFMKHPFVILNGCETGAVGYNVPTDSSSFVRTFLARGASGVVATEAKVLQGSMYFFADTLLKKLISGEGATEAVTDTRRYMYYGSTPADPATWPRDPIGLFYSYHGLPDVSFPKGSASLTTATIHHAKSAKGI